MEAQPEQDVQVMDLLKETGIWRAIIECRALVDTSQFSTGTHQESAPRRPGGSPGLLCVLFWGWQKWARIARALSAVRRASN